MVRAFDAAVAAMCSSIPAVVLAQFLEQQPSGLGTSAVKVVVVLPLAETATLAFFATAVCVFHHLRHAGGGGNRRLPELVTFSLFASAAVLEYVLFVQPPEGVAINIDVRGLGLAAARALPAAAAAAFFLGMALVFSQVLVGGGGRHGVVVAGDGPVWILSNVALGAAAADVGLMAMALYTGY